ncbi:Crp/Fnr family transcriptional regulator [Fluviicola taffensis]|uniref:Crp/Fnr family transcriptional regulator n=1 Tax=Fluviicola taffensis TaxID=191579 RepID=UPI003137CF98
MFEQILNQIAVSRNFKKGEVLQSAGQESSKGYFVKKGLLRSFTIDDNGKEHIYMFASEGWILSDIEKEVFGNKTVLYIEAIEDSEVYIFNPGQIYQLDLQHEYTDYMISSLMKRIGVMQRRILALMSASARERYESFLQIYPDLQNRVPQKMIASYLGITPEALSKIRGQIIRNK